MWSCTGGDRKRPFDHAESGLKVLLIVACFRRNTNTLMKSGISIRRKLMFWSYPMPTLITAAGFPNWSRMDLKVLSCVPTPPGAFLCHHAVDSAKIQMSDAEYYTERWPVRLPTDDARTMKIAIVNRCTPMNTFTWLWIAFLWLRSMVSGQ